MDGTVITQMISTVGFPIAACCVMFWQNNKLQETLTSFVSTLQKMDDRMDSIERKLSIEWEEKNNET